MKGKNTSSQGIEPQQYVPNWRDETCYPKPDELSANYWRWEFLRRDDGYRREWKRYRSSKHSFRLAIEGDQAEGFDIPYYPEGHQDCWGDIWRLLRKYGLARLLDPAIARPHYLPFYFIPFAPDPLDDPQLQNIKIKEEHIPWKLRFPYLAWFDIWKPIKPQLDFYTELLNREQSIALDLLRQRAVEIKGGKNTKGFMQKEVEEIIAHLQSGSTAPRSARPPSRARRDIDSKNELYPTRLRVLDARRQKASWGAIGKMLFAGENDCIGKARSEYRAAKSLWWKIPVERSLGPIIGMEEACFQDSYSVLPALESHDPIVNNWLNLLPPTLRRLVVSALS